MKILAPKNLFLAAVSVSMMTLIVNTFIDKGDGIVSTNLTGASGPVEGITSQVISSVESVSNSGIPAAETDSQIKVSAAGAYLMNAADPLYAFRNQKQWPIASVTKLMTSFVARRLMTSTEIITIGEGAVAAPGEAGDFKAGEKFKSEDLIRAMLVSSSNDAAMALANHYGEEAFVAAMNQLAADIGMKDTAFVDAAGLSVRNLSTPDDLSRLVRSIWTEDPAIFTITRLPRTSIVDIDNGQSRKLVSTNLFAGQNNFLGGKTGQIPNSDGNLVSIFSLSSQPSPVIIVVLGAQDRFKETEKILTKL